jgi:hypothetical protein
VPPRPCASLKKIALSAVSIVISIWSATMPPPL